MIPALDGVAAGTLQAPHAELSLLLLGAGLLVGLYHAIEPDHVAAMFAIAGRQRSKNMSKRRAGANGSKYGMIWGAGHTSAILLVAFAVLVFSASIPDGLFVMFEAAAGVMLIMLGVSVASDGSRRLRFLSGLRLHSHPHTHEDGTTHSHPHTHEDGTDHRHGHRSYLVGCIHGLAGSGGLVALWAAATATATAAVVVPTDASLAASAILAEAHAPILMLSLASVFGVGSVIGMAAVAWALSLLPVVCGRADSARNAIRYASSAIAIALGAYVVAGSVASMHIL